jgi:hypothetical protein
MAACYVWVCDEICAILVWGFVKLRFGNRYTSLPPIMKYPKLFRFCVRVYVNNTKAQRFCV